MRIQAKIKKWDNRLVIRLCGQLPFKEADLLKGLTPTKAHADELVSITDKELAE